MVTSEIELPTLIDGNGLKRPARICQGCGEVIPKPPKQSWTQYSEKKWHKECMGKHQRAIQFARSADYSEDRELPLNNYVITNTNNGRDLADFHIGVMREVKAHEAKEDADGNKEGEVCPKCNAKYFGYYYKGLQVTADMANKAIEYLTMNGWGRYGQRAAPDDKPKRSLGEISLRFRFLVKKLFKDSANVEAVYAILDKEGL